MVVPIYPFVCTYITKCITSIYTCYWNSDFVHGRRHSFGCTFIICIMELEAIIQSILSTFPSISNREVRTTDPWIVRNWPDILQEYTEPLMPTECFHICNASLYGKTIEINLFATGYSIGKYTSCTTKHSWVTLNCTKHCIDPYWLSPGQFGIYIMDGRMNLPMNHPMHISRWMLK